MNSRERIISAIKFKKCDKVPIEARDVIGAPSVYPNWFQGGRPGEKGKYLDGWGCEWHALEDGVCGEVKGHPLHEWGNIKSFRPPYDILKKVDLSYVSKTRESYPDKFLMSCWEPSMPNIFERMQHLRGAENLFMDIAYGDLRVIKLRDMLFEYYMEQLEMWCNTDVDGIHIHDDWGSQTALLISPVVWKEIFKPVYKAFCDLSHSYGKIVVMHSDGYIMDILSDLCEIGVDAVNSQLFCMPIEKLAEQYKNKLCFWGEIDRQWIQPFGTPSDMSNACYRIANAFFKDGITGFIAQCYYTMNVPEENKKAEFLNWEKISKEYSKN